MCVGVFVCVRLYACVCEYTNMKKQCIQKIILFVVELFPNVKHFRFYIEIPSGWC